MKYRKPVVTEEDISQKMKEALEDIVWRKPSAAALGRRRGRGSSRNSGPMVQQRLLALIKNPKRWGVIAFGYSSQSSAASIISLIRNKNNQKEYFPEGFDVNDFDLIWDKTKDPVLKICVLSRYVGPEIEDEEYGEDDDDE